MHAEGAREKLFRMIDEMRARGRVEVQAGGPATHSGATPLGALWRRAVPQLILPGHSLGFFAVAGFGPYCFPSFSYSLNSRDRFDRGTSAMDLFQKSRFLIPVDVLVVLAINIVVGVFGYYAVRFFTG